MNDRVRAPGLVWNRHGKPVWRAPRAAILEGYPVKSANLHFIMESGGAEALKQRCAVLQSEIVLWRKDYKRKRKLLSRKSRQGLIYFVLSGHRMKVGFTHDVKGRMIQLQTSNPEKLTLLGTIHGTIDMEQFIHRILAPSRQRGEWYTLTAEVRDLLDRYIFPAGTSVEPVLATFLRPNTPLEIHPQNQQLITRVPEHS